MNVVIGDDPFNQWFLKTVVRSCGLDQITGTHDADELLGLAPSADLVIFDPGLQRYDESGPDVAFELIRLVPSFRLVIVSSRAKELERARRNGIVGARKVSVLRLEGIQASILEVLDNIATDTGKATSEYRDLELWSALDTVAPTADERAEHEEPSPAALDWPLLISVPSSANASVLEPALAPTR